MTGTVAAVANRVPGCCHAMHCNRDGCRVDLQGAPSVRLLIDMDCDGLQIPRQQKRCDYLFIGEKGTATWIAPIELKSGGFRATEVLDQLAGGVRAVEPFLPPGISFQLVPVLAHGKSIRRIELKRLRSGKIQLRGQPGQIAIMKCGEALKQKLRARPPQR